MLGITTFVLPLHHHPFSHSYPSNIVGLLRVSQEPALLGQIEHADTAMRDETEYKSFVEDVLSPCVVQLAVAVRGA